MMQAEACGRERRLHETALRRELRSLGVGLLLVLVLALVVAAGTVRWLGAW